MTALIHFRVTGRVQGVSFRYATQKEATKLGLRGWVKNNSDESVEGAAAGPDSQINSFRSFLSKGPTAAKVQDVEYKKDIKEASDGDIKSAMGGDLSNFEVR